MGGLLSLRVLRAELQGAFDYNVTRVSCGAADRWTRSLGVMTDSAGYYRLKKEYTWIIMVKSMSTAIAQKEF